MIKNVKWEIKRLPITGGIAICAGDELITGGLSEEEANLIVTAINTCIEINPENPLAVAGAITNLFQACKLASDNNGTGSDAKVAVAKAEQDKLYSLGEP